MKWMPKLACLMLYLLVLPSGNHVYAAGKSASGLLDMFAPLEIHGFIESRAGMRIQDDPHSGDFSVMETRISADIFTCTDWAEFKLQGDAWADGISEKGDGTLREAWCFLRPFDWLDLKIGRQIITWGTGDLVFLNDLFPKDWQSYFIGRNSEYMKAPSDAVKFGIFHDWTNIDLVYSPRFDADRYITGEYISYWDAASGGYAGEDEIIHADHPNTRFDDDELAIRIYKNISNYELAFYGYWGFWKQPVGQRSSGTPFFPQLNAYGFSLRGQFAGGIGNLEFSYYDSVDDSSGKISTIKNSEMRYLIGYNRDLAQNLNASIQYYVEQMLDYHRYEESYSGKAMRDQFRHVITLQITQLLMSQNLELSLSAYYSPSDQDAYLRPKVSYAVTDDINIETGANIFIGEKDYTFFGQFEKNTSFYVSVRYSI